MPVSLTTDNCCPPVQHEPISTQPMEEAFDQFIMESHPKANYSLIQLAWDQEECPSSKSGTTFLILVYSTMIAVGIVGNSCLVFVIARQKEMHNVTNIFIANLSCSDILMCVFCLPVTLIYTLMDRWILGEALCKLTPFVQCLSVTVSIFSLVLIAMERFQLIVHPTGWKPVVSQSYTAVGIIWVVACLISAPFLSFTVLDNLPLQNLSLPFPGQDHWLCTESWPTNSNRLAYTTSLLVFQYFLPLGLIAACYLSIFLRLRRRKDMVERARDSSRDNRAKGSRRINVMLGSIVALFAVCWLPLNIFNTVFDWHHELMVSCQHNLIFSVCHLVAMASTCVNPIVYGFLNSNFQKQLKATLSHCRCWGTAERYENLPLSAVSTEVTKESHLSKGSISIHS
ncbi:neuropeptide Y receptor type 6-like [Gadus macrocephalus]|uniref:neuropeptide Y receptor type 6-like n=1 Tax=Gadus macrocephalus TaxID=80720 RepID=UPI0028CB2AD6|nr:neuropeptide Y receptor type 6-like [Gadus macrocephalus]